MRAMERRSAAVLSADAWRQATRVADPAGHARGRGNADDAPRTSLAGVMLPLVLAAILVLAVIGLSPATAQLCAISQDVPCGP